MTECINGKIYILRSLNTEKVYIGSTTLKYLCWRLSKHNWDYKNKKEAISSSILFDYGDVYIELLEEYSCLTKKELVEKEDEWINNFGELCVNKNKAVGNRLESAKKWREVNRDKINAKRRQNRVRNPRPPKLSKEEWLERRRQKYQENKEELQKKARERAREKAKLKKKSAVNINADLQIGEGNSKGQEV